jgi:glycosyltransferase involved in cell wall biosynthesis
LNTNNPVALPILNKKDQTLSLVFSFRNEEENIPELVSRIREVLKSEIEKNVISDFEMIFVNDDSTDRSRELLMELAEGENDIRIINMSRNFGVYPCVFAGMKYAKGDAVIYMDSDLQDPPEIIPKMLEAWKGGEKVADVVHTQRTKRLGESKFRLLLTMAGYRLLKKISHIDLPIEVGDYKLLSRRAVKHLLQFKEKNPYTRGLVCWIGFKQSTIQYQRQARFSGETKFPTYRSFFPNFLNSALISFSAVPLQIASMIGLLGFIASIPVFTHVLIERLSGQALPGWSAIMVTVLFLGSTQLLALGVLGLYIHAIYLEVKGRPNYIIESVYGFEDDSAGKEINL